VELLGRKSSGSGLESREYGRKDPSCCPRGTLYPQTLVLRSPTRVGRSVGIVRCRIQATEFVCFDSLPTKRRRGRCWPDLVNHKLSTVHLGAD
jgi:hypothetical protein